MNQANLHTLDLLAPESFGDFQMNFLNLAFNVASRAKTWPAPSARTVTQSTDWNTTWKHPTRVNLSLPSNVHPLASVFISELGSVLMHSKAHKAINVWGFATLTVCMCAGQTRRPCRALRWWWSGLRSVPTATPTSSRTAASTRGTSGPTKVRFHFCFCFVLFFSPPLSLPLHAQSHWDGVDALLCPSVSIKSISALN